MNKIFLIIDNIRRNRDNKILASNFAYLSLLQVVSYIFPLITMPYLANVIGVENFGKIAFANAVMIWIQTFADWGFNYTATRDVSKNRENVDVVYDIFSRVFWARFILTILSFIIILILLVLIKQFRENAIVILFTFLMIPGQLMFPEWFFQAIERMRYITILNILSKILFTILVFIFIKEKEDYILQPLFVSLGYILSGLVSMYIILIKWKISLKLVSLKSVFLTIKLSTDVFLNNLLPNFYNSFSAVFLGFCGGDIANGIFDAGRKFITLAIQIINTTSRTFFPYLARKSEKHSLYKKIILSFSFISSIILYIISPLLIKIFFPESFSGSVVVMRIMTIYVFFIAVSDVYGVNYMILRGYEKQRRKIIVLASFIGFISSVLLVRYFSYVGAAISITFSGFIIAFFSFVWVYKNERSIK